jgi:hypothetical protein
MDHCNSYIVLISLVIFPALSDLELEDPVKSPFSFLRP